LLTNVAFWSVTPHNLGKIYKIIQLKMEAEGSIQTVVTFYQTTRRRISEDVFLIVSAMRHPHMFNRCFS